MCEDVLVQSQGDCAKVAASRMQRHFGNDGVWFALPLLSHGILLSTATASSSPVKNSDVSEAAQSLPAFTASDVKEEVEKSDNTLDNERDESWGHEGVTRHGRG